MRGWLARLAATAAVLWAKVPGPVREQLASVARHFATAFSAVFVMGILGVWMLPSWEEKKAAAIALVCAAAAAGARAAIPALKASAAALWRRYVGGA